MIFLKSAGQTLFKTILTCNFWIIIVDFIQSNTVILICSEAACILWCTICYSSVLYCPALYSTQIWHFPGVTPKFWAPFIRSRQYVRKWHCTVLHCSVLYYTIIHYIVPTNRRTVILLPQGPCASSKFWCKNDQVEWARR